MSLQPLSLLSYARLLNAFHFLWDCLSLLQEDMHLSKLQAAYLADLEGRKRVRSSAPALRGRPAHASPGSLRLPACPLGCPEGAGRAPAEAMRPSEGAPEVLEGAGLPSRSCCRSAARALSRLLPWPVFAPFLHVLSRLESQCAGSLLAVVHPWAPRHAIQFCTAVLQAHTF